MEENIASNRYLVYSLLGCQVNCDPTCLRKNHKKFSGVVESVTRDIFKDRILVTVSGSRYAFDEPTLIVRGEGSIIFIYGVLDEYDESDESLFKEIRDSAYGESINDILSRPAGKTVKRVTFLVGEKLQGKKKRGRR